jgi:tetratricopeptide (TPR) repeat protein
MRGAVQLQTVSLSTYICAGGHCCASNTRTSATSQTFARYYEDKTYQQAELLLLELQWRMNTGNLKTALKLVEKTEHKWPALHETVSPSKLIALSYNCAIACFVAHQFHKALHWFNRVISFSRNGLRIETRQTSLLLRNIVYFELDKILEFPREKQLLTKTRGVDVFSQFEYALNNTLRQLHRSDKKINQSTIQQQLNQLLEQLQEFKKQSPVKQIEGLEETMIWLQSRLGSRPMIEVMFPKGVPDKTEEFAVDVNVLVPA